MPIQPGVYRHYKGNLYRVHHTILNESDLEEMVLYEPLYDVPADKKFWTRPTKVFLELVVYNGVEMPRFTLVREETEPPTSVNQPTENEMTELVKLMSLLQITKQQPLTGYISAGIKLSEIPTLAEHQYAAALSAFFLGNQITHLGGKIDTSKIVSMLLIHDLGELFGGDISGPLHRVYPQLREFKDKIGDCAVDLLGKFLDSRAREEFIQLYNEFEHGDSDEKWVGKILDQMDHQFFLEHSHYGQRQITEKLTYRKKFVTDHIYKLTDRIKDPVTKVYMTQFLAAYADKFYEQGFVGLNELVNP